MKYIGLALLTLALSMAGRLFSVRLRDRVKTLEKFLLMMKIKKT